VSACDIPQGEIRRRQTPSAAQRDGDAAAALDRAIGQWIQGSFTLAGATAARHAGLEKSVPNELKSGRFGAFAFSRAAA
jgi:hypothetical protein